MGAGQHIAKDLCFIRREMSSCLRVRKILKQHEIGGFNSTVRTIQNLREVLV